MATAVTTPRAQLRLRALVVLAGFVVLIVVIAFVAAFRNTGASTHPATLVALDSSIRDGHYRSMHVTANVALAGDELHSVDLYLVRVDGQLHALWARSTHLGCRTVPRAHGFEDPCGGSMFALDGGCVSGPCPRGLDEFMLVERQGVTYADLRQLVRGQPR